MRLLLCDSWFDSLPQILFVTGSCFGKCIGNVTYSVVKLINNDVNAIESLIQLKSLHCPDAFVNKLFSYIKAKIWRDH